MKKDQVIKKFPAFYETRKFITVFTGACLGPYHESDKLSSQPPTLFQEKRSINILLSVSRSSKWSLPFSSSNQHFVCISHLSHVCYMPHPSHPSWFDHPNNGIGWYYFRRYKFEYHKQNCEFIIKLLIATNIGNDSVIFQLSNSVVVWSWWIAFFIENFSSQGKCSYTTKICYCHSHTFELLRIF
jgi:hypothetical protein